MSLSVRGHAKAPRAFLVMNRCGYRFEVRTRRRLQEHVSLGRQMRRTGHDAYAANQRRLTVNVETFDTFPDSQSHAAGRQPRVAKRLPDSPPLAVFGADLPTNTTPIGRVRKTQDLRQRFSGQLFVWETTDKAGIAKVQVNGPFCGGRGTRTHKSVRTTVFKTVRLPISVALHSKPKGWRGGGP
jgi:hypothetical protein